MMGPFFSSNQVEQPPSHHMITHHKGGAISRCTLTHNYADVITASMYHYVEPQNYTKASKVLDSCKVMVKEYTTLPKNQTWDLVPQPSNIILIGRKWVSNVKLKSYGSLECDNAHLVTKGFHQCPDLYHIKTFSPITNHVAYTLSSPLPILKDGLSNN